jgi:Na+-translocating ferredoxin:NAD+ oxidoreductase RnfC subunit
MVHWKLILKRILRRIRYIFILRDLLSWEYESCERCGHCFRICWSVKDEKWIAVHGDDSGCLCIDCFIELAHAKNIEINNDDIEMQLFIP